MDGFTQFHYTIPLKLRKKKLSCCVFYSYYMVTSKCQDEKHTHVSILACLQTVQAACG